MKITRRQLRQLILEAAIVSDDPLVMQVTSMNSYYDLVEVCERTNNIGLVNALLKAVRERNVGGLKHIGRFGIGFIPADRPGQPASYRVTYADTRRAVKEIDEKAYKYLNYNLKLQDSGALAYLFNPCAKALKLAAKEAGRLVQDAIDNPDRYTAPERSFFQKAGSFLTGKGFNE